MSDMNKAMAMAVEAYSEELDCFGKPYIFHILGLTAKLKTEEEKLGAVLYKLLADNLLKQEEIVAFGFSEEVAVAMEILLSKNHEDYFPRLKNNLLARNIKLAELEFKMQEFRKSRGSNDEFLELVTELKKTVDYLEE